MGFKMGNPGSLVVMMKIKAEGETPLAYLSPCCPLWAEGHWLPGCPGRLATRLPVPLPTHSGSPSMVLLVSHQALACSGFLGACLLLSTRSLLSSLLTPVL